VFGGVTGSVEQLLLKEHRWYPVKIGGAMQPQLRYMAVYESAPTSAIRYLAPIDAIEAWQDSDKLVVCVRDPIEKIGPVEFVRGGRVPYGVTAPRYTNCHRLKSAKTLEDVW
jgi:hypothetical protein